ncbi:MAG: DUF3592 domain-containing protein [Rhodocyclaceae bacterium]|jgi:hypothetical protein|nr:DUF3592 domain-containing protein [Rhodocyclaceae bacterium]MCA3023669.1 DUF3592 domain-containing protein [Rhodocyclaceae bacterium]MCA3030324.1 DUF3592 domain-containing protein [Rhodocyclaceae bacterium]MCA3035656.1 DUF3592 domain-containing protein [Rhodocyclaceae bacterium]MCA3044226.1 DUF3592 domain-containing protein [Rhodocyclaceae bacterium]
MADRLLMGGTITLSLCVLGLALWTYVWARGRYINWVEVRVTLLSLHVPDALLGKPLTASRTGNTIDVLYSYEYQGQTYRASSLTWSDALLTPEGYVEFGRALKAAYDTDRTFVGWINAKRPTQVTLSLRVNKLAPVLMFVGIVGIGASLAFR